MLFYAYYSCWFIITAWRIYLTFGDEIFFIDSKKKKKCDIVICISSKQKIKIIYVHNIINNMFYRFICCKYVQYFKVFMIDRKLLGKYLIFIDVLERNLNFYWKWELHCYLNKDKILYQQNIHSSKYFYYSRRYNIQIKH